MPAPTINTAASKTTIKAITMQRRFRVINHPATSTKRHTQCSKPKALSRFTIWLHCLIFRAFAKSFGNRQKLLHLAVLLALCCPEGHHYSSRSLLLRAAIRSSMHTSLYLWLCTPFELIMQCLWLLECRIYHVINDAILIKNECILLGMIREIVS